MNKKKIIIATGGTGGHIFPAISLAQYLSKKNFEVEITTDIRGKKFFNEINFLEIKTISTATIFVKNPILILKNIFLIIFSIIKSILYLKKKKPHLVFGVGGYSSFPVCFASKTLGIPLLIYENNLLLGKANKILSFFAKKIFTSFSEVQGIDGNLKTKSLYCGNIIRQEIMNYKHNFNEKNDLKILVLGGSQAAKIFGEKLPRIFEMIKKENLKISIYQQCLPEQNNSLKNFYESISIQNEIFNFDPNILKYYKKIDLVITRSGSSVSAELLNCNIPFISVPLEKSADDHQNKNAEFFQKKGFCFLIKENQIDESLFLLIKSFYKDKSILKNCVNNQKSYSKINTMEKILNEIENITDEKN